MPLPLMTSARAAEVQRGSLDYEDNEQENISKS